MMSSIRSVLPTPLSAGPTLHSRCQTRPAEAGREFRVPFDREPGGARRDRTDDLMLAKHALYQLSYGPAG